MKIDEDFDFGFTSVSDDDIDTGSTKEILSLKEIELQEMKQRVKDLYKAVEPLLHNLRKDSESNAYIHWPDRAKVIDEYKQKLINIRDGRY